MIVNWTKKRLLVVPYKGKSGMVVGSITLLPGCNDVDDDIWKSAREMVEDKIKHKLIIEEHAKIEIKDVPIPNTKGKTRKIVKIDAKTLKELEPDEAEDIVKNTFDLKTLKKWKKGESRDAVRSVIIGQIETVEKEGELEPNKKDKDSKKDN